MDYEGQMVKIKKSCMVYLRLLMIFILVLFIFEFVSAEKISVLVMEDNVDPARGFSVASGDVEMEVTHEFSSIDGFAAEIEKEDLDELRAKFGGNVFVEDRVFSISLDLSVPQIGGNDSWILESSGINLTGAGQTICIIDTGVNYSHPALGGCYGNNDPNSSCRVLGGYNYIDDGSYPMDDHGHGTHVAGIIISNDSTYAGVAPGAKIIAMKALNSAGNSESASDVLAAIDWCISNASKFNISVISMSLGDNSTYNYYCDNETSWDNIINVATATGISVVISAGNCDQAGQTNCTSGVAFPACIKNVTRVGAVNDADDISGFGPSGNGYMRGALFELMAPGVNIISTLFGGGFGQKSGTSMAAPHIAGSFVLIKQYLNLSGQIKSVDQIESILNNSGVRVDDTSGSGYNFARINVHNALLSIDVDVPNVALTFPQNNHINLSLNHTFICDASDWQLSNVTFKIWNSSGLYYNETVDISGTSNESSFSLENMSRGEYEWNCFANDSLSNFGSNSVNFSLTIGEIEMILNSPENNSITKVNETYFNCTSHSVDSYALTNVTFNIWNSSNFLIFNEARNISGVENETVFSYNFSEEDTYHWECLALNNNSDEGDGINFSISYDPTSPVISDLGVDTSTGSAVISWTTDESSNSSISMDAGSWSNSSNYFLNHSILVSSLVSSTSYNYAVTSCDEAGNCDSELASFLTGTVPSSGGGSSSSGSSSGVKVVEIKEMDLWRKKTELLRVNDKVNFYLASGGHSLKVEKVGVDYAGILIESDPVSLNLSVGEEVRLNLSSADYYDLVVRLEGISNRKANVSLLRVFEKIAREAEPEDIVENITKDDDRVFHVTDEEDRNWGDFVLIATVILILIVGFFVTREEKPEKKIIKRSLKHARKVEKVLKKKDVPKKKKKLKRKKPKKN